MDPERRPFDERQKPRWRRLLALPEGKTLLAGVIVTLLYLTAVGLTAIWSGDLAQGLWGMTGAHVLGGRALGMSWGYAEGMPHWLVMVASMTIETFLVLLFYPLFVFSYNKLIVIEQLRETMERTHRAAEAHRQKLLKFGVPGLLLFVWFPFWLTGPLVGCVIGFLIGLRPLTILAVVLAGTYLAIFSWGFVLEPLNHFLMERVGYYVPFVLVVLVILVAVSIRIRYAFAHEHASEAKD